MRNLSLRTGWLAVCAAISCFWNSACAQDAPAPIALVGGRILTVDQAGVIENGTVLIKDGKIEAVGTDVTVPVDARRIDVSGMTVAPGLIDVRSTLWVISDSVTSTATNGSVDLSKALDPFSEDWIEVAAQGVTAVCVQPSGSMGGRGVVLRVAPVADDKQLIIEEVSGIQASLGVSGRSGNAADRYAQYTALKNTLNGVKKYQEEWKKYREALKKWEEEQKNPKKKPDAKDGKKADEKKTEEKKPEEKKPETPPVVRIRGRVVPPQVLEQMRKRGMRIPGMPEASQGKPATAAKGKDGKPKEPKRDKVKDVLIGVLEGKVPLRIEVHRADDAANALKLAEEFKIEIVLEGLSDLGRTWDAIRQSRPPLVAGPMVDFEPVRVRRSTWFSDVAAGDNLIAVSTFSRNSRGSRLLRSHVAAAVAQGLSTARALEAVTINAAKVLGVDDKLGSIAKGKNGDIAVFSGHPTDPSASVMLTVSKGAITYEAKQKPGAITTSRTEVSGIPPHLPDRYALLSSRVQQPDGSFAPAVIGVSGGRIVSVGNAVEDIGPSFDLGDAVITSGLVVGHAPGSTATSVDPIAAHAHAADNYNPDSTGLLRMTKAGFTAVGYAPVSTNVVAGQMACIRFDANDPVALSDGAPHTVAAKFVLSNAARNPSRFPGALSGQVDLLTRFLAGEELATRLYVPGSIEAAMDKAGADLVAAIKARKIPAVFEAETDGEVRAALDLIESNNLRGVLLHPREFGDSLERIARLKVGIIARTVQVADYDWYAGDLAAASKAGVPIGFSATTPEQIRATAGLLVNAGMSPEAALRALTSDAAGACGLSDVGRIATNTPADLVIWTASPVDLGAHAAHIILDGQVWKEDK